MKYYVKLDSVNNFVTENTDLEDVIAYTKDQYGLEGYVELYRRDNSTVLFNTTRKNIPKTVEIFTLDDLSETAVDSFKLKQLKDSFLNNGLKKYVVEYDKNVIEEFSYTTFKDVVKTVTNNRENDAIIVETREHEKTVVLKEDGKEYVWIIAEYN